MKKRPFIGLDVHCPFCELAVLNPAGRVVRRERCDTTIPALVEALDTVPRPRAVVMEEGPMASWLWRHLHTAVDALAVSEPRRHRLIAQDGAKDDALDAEKLAWLYRGGFSKEVHQVGSLAQAVFKQQVALYPYRVRQRVREAHRITHWFRQQGVVIREKAYVAAADRPALWGRLPDQGPLRELVQELGTSDDAVVAQEEEGRQRLVRAAQQVERRRRFEDWPGVGWIRAATLYAYLDTPWRFPSKEALWK